MKKDYTPVMRTVEESVRTYSLPILPTSIFPLTDFVSVGRTKLVQFHIFGNEEPLRRYSDYLDWSIRNREIILANDPEVENMIPKNPQLNIAIDYWRKQYNTPNWSPHQPVSEFRVPERTTGIRSISYSFDNNGRYGLILAEVGHDGSLAHTVLAPDRMDISFREQITQLFNSHGAFFTPYSPVEFREPLSHVILLRFLLEKLKDGK